MTDQGRRWSRRWWSAVLGSALAVLLTSWSGTVDATNDAGSTTWKVVTMVNPGIGYDHLLGVVAVASNDVWAVGNYSLSGIRGLTLVEHWDGTAWTVVNSPNRGKGDCGLSGVAAAASNDIWAVGWCAGSVSNLTKATLVEHWNGTAWSVVASPTAPNRTAQLTAVSVAGPGDVWAVGTTEVAGNQTSALAEHWDGTAWTQVAVNGIAGISSELVGVAAIASNDVWAVGTQMTASGMSSLVMHWDGISWAPSAAPAGTGFQQLTAVAGSATNDVWAVGFQSEVGSTHESALVFHWDGTGWSDVSPASALPTQDNRLLAVAVKAGIGAWAVGSRFTGTINKFHEPANRTVVIGSASGTWTASTTVDPSALDDVFYAVAFTPAGDAWTVGYQGAKTLSEHATASP